MQAVQQRHKDPHPPEGGWGNPNGTTWGTEMERRSLLTSSWPTHIWSSGRWTVLLQKPPPAALYPRAITITSSDNEEPPKNENESRSPVVPDQCQTHSLSVIQDNDTLSLAHSVPDRTEPVPALLPRRSGLTRRTPTWLEDYDLCWTLERWFKLGSILILLLC